jgi:transcriptional regulator with XRE-family HTH domain
MVRALRGDMTQADLARVSGVPQSTISAIEIGNRTFRGVHLEAILSATKTTGLEATRLLRALAEKLDEKPSADPPPLTPAEFDRVVQAEQELMRKEAAEHARAQRLARKPRTAPPAPPTRPASKH